jgi:hypothetical protein
MKLHPEISIGWVMMYAFVLVSLSGQRTNEINDQTHSEKAYQKDTVVYNSETVTDFLRDSLNLSKKSRIFKKISWRKY